LVAGDGSLLLVETPGRASQRTATEAVLRAISPVTLAYARAGVIAA
jgi:hypothetical protein